MAENKVEVSKTFLRLVGYVAHLNNRTIINSEGLKYLSSDVISMDIDEFKEMFKKDIEDGEIKFEDLNERELLKLRFKKWEDGIYLIPLHIFRLLPDDMEVCVGIKDNKPVKIVKDCDRDTRYGCTAYTFLFMKNK